MIPLVKNWDAGTKEGITESNDCTVKAFMELKGISYKSARTFMHENNYRKPFEGMKFYVLKKMFAKHLKGRWTREYAGLTFNQTYKKLDKDKNYGVVVIGHIFTVKKGVVYGNHNDNSKRKRVQWVFELNDNEVDKMKLVSEMKSGKTVVLIINGTRERIFRGTDKKSILSLTSTFYRCKRKGKTIELGRIE